MNEVNIPKETNPETIEGKMNLENLQDYLKNKAKSNIGITRKNKEQSKKARKTSTNSRRKNRK